MKGVDIRLFAVTSSGESGCADGREMRCAVSLSAYLNLRNALIRLIGSAETLFARAGENTVILLSDGGGNLTHVHREEYLNKVDPKPSSAFPSLLSIIYSFFFILLEIPVQRIGISLISPLQDCVV